MPEVELLDQEYEVIKRLREIMKHTTGFIRVDWRMEDGQGKLRIEKDGKEDLVPIVFKPN